MGLLDLVKNVARSSPRQNAQTKTSAAGSVIAWSNVGQPKWTPRRYDQLAEEGYRKNVVAYRCVTHIAKACAAVPWLLYDKQGNEIDQHPLLTLLRHPNPMQDGVTFLESIYAFLEISGNAYIEAVMPRDAAQPVELYVLRPDRMKVIPGSTGLPEGYQYTVNGQVTAWPADPVTGDSAILHLKRFHPLDDWYGLAPMEAALLSIDQHNAAGAWNQSLLNQGARPSGALVYAPKDGPSTLTDDQVQRLREEMGQLYQGQRNSGRPLILEGGLDWREMSLSPKDMDWLAGRDTAARDIALAFGVPAQMIGIPGAQTYANMAEARIAFYEETVLPILTNVIAGFDHWLTPQFDDNLELDFDPDSISALATRRQAQWSNLKNADFLTRNEKREAAGYAPEDSGSDDDEGSGDSDDDPAEFSFAKFNPNHDELRRFTFGTGGDDNDNADNNINDPPIQPVYPLESGLSLLFGGEALVSAGEAASAVAGTEAATAADIASISKRLENILTPDGNPIGTQGGSSTVRELTGGSDAAEELFKNLTKNGTLDNTSTYDGTRYRFPDNSFIGYKPISESGPPTIDINIPSLWNKIRKIKFLDGG